jgi:hypothetical protein
MNLQARRRPVPPLAVGSGGVPEAVISTSVQQILVVTGVLAVLASITLQAALKNSSHSITPNFFFG